MTTLRTRYVTHALALLLAAGLTLTACGGSAAGGQAGGSGIEETISVSGAFALFPLMTVWADQYHSQTPGVRFDIQAGGAGKGMTDMLSGVADIAMLSREMRPEEADQGAFAVPVAIDAVVATINPANPHAAEILAHGLTPEAAAAIWLSGQSTTWGDLLGNGSTEPINVYTRSDAAGAAEVWAHYMGGGSQEELRGTAVNGDPGLAEAVRQDRLGIGFNNVGFAYDPATGTQIDGLRVVPLDLNGDGAISPDESFYDTREALVNAITSETYPFPPARVLYLVTKGAPAPVIRDFYRWVLADGQASVHDAGYVNLSNDRLQGALGLIQE
jgi:phosphate transport system substrate-binding protein